MGIAISSSMFFRSMQASLRLLGRFQAENAALVALALKTVFPDLDEEVLERGLGKACLPGRFEILSPVDGFAGIPALILDGAHTPRSVGLTMESFDRLYGGGEQPNAVAAGAGISSAGRTKKPVLLFACAADKDIEDIATLFEHRFSAVFLSRPGQAKAADMGRMERAFRAAGIVFKLNPDYTQAIGDALREADRAAVPLLVTGSFYLVAEVKQYLSCRG